MVECAKKESHGRGEDMSRWSPGGELQIAASFQGSQQIHILLRSGPYGSFVNAATPRFSLYTVTEDSS